MLRPLLALALGYALGCAVSAWYVVKWRTGADLRALHSGTTGARNAGRVLGRGTFALVAAVDLARGAAAVLAARGLGLSGWWLAVAGAAALIGHWWPAQLGFHGGKGIAVGIGVLAASLPWDSTPDWTLAACVALGVTWKHLHRRPALHPAEG